MQLEKKRYLKRALLYSAVILFCGVIAALILPFFWKTGDSYTRGYRIGQIIGGALMVAILLPVAALLKSDDKSKQNSI
jgi:hypothetical protein